MEFWIIMITFIALGGTCSLAGTWWDRKKKEERRRKEITKPLYVVGYHPFDNGLPNPVENDA